MRSQKKRSLHGVNEHFFDERNAAAGHYGQKLNSVNINIDDAMRTITKFILIALSVMGIAWLIPGVEVNSFTSALWVALVLSVLNLIVKPVLIVLTIPVTIFTLGLFLLVINGLMIWLASSWISGFFVETFWKAILFSIVLSVATYLIERLLPPSGDKKHYYRSEIRHY